MHPDFDLPSRGSVDGRTSSITAAFFQAITPVMPPSFEEVEEALSILGMSRANCHCAYCGDARTEWDHFRPIVRDRQPTGYITEIANLVPACGKCNQSKGNKEWRDWINSKAPRSPKTRGVADLDNKIRRLEEYERWRPPTKVDYATFLGPAKWSEYQALLDAAVSHLVTAQAVAKEIAAIVRERLADPTAALAKAK